MQQLAVQDVMNAFDPIDRPDVQAPRLEGIRWDELDYLGWRHPGQDKAFMVVPLRERLVGLVFHISSSSRPGICDLCFGIDRECGAASVLVHTWAKPRIAYGITVCSNLDCSDSVRGYKWVYRMGETISAGRRIERLQENVTKFARLVAGLQEKTA